MHQQCKICQGCWWAVLCFTTSVKLAHASGAKATSAKSIFQTISDTELCFFFLGREWNLKLSIILTAQWRRTLVTLSTCTPTSRKWMETGKVQMKRKSKKSLRSIWVSSLTPARCLLPFIIQVSTLRSLGESEAGAGSQNQDGMGHTVTGFLSGNAYKSGFSVELGCVTYKCLIFTTQHDGFRPFVANFISG